MAVAVAGLAVLLHLNFKRLLELLIQSQLVVVG
jgi:hypothetical protein